MTPTGTLEALADARKSPAAVRSGRPSRSILGGLCLWLAVACATRPPPEIPLVPLAGWGHLEGRAPAPGPELPAAAAEELAAGWALLVEGRLGEADARLASLRSMAPGDPGVLTADGFLALRSGRIAEGDALFDRVLSADPANVLAAFGSVLGALEGEDREQLFERLKRLSELAPAASVVAETLPRLALEIAEDRLMRARELARSAATGSEVADAYRAAIEAMPDSADLFLEAAEAAVAAGDAPSAKAWFDAVAASAAAGSRQALLAELAAAELLADERRLAESLTRLERILGDPGLGRFTELRSRAAELEHRLEVARLSELYSRIREAERVTREQLAALLAAEIGAPENDAVESVEPVIAIDLERSWAANLIRTAVGAGYLQLFPDHTFKPRGLVTRAELAESLAAALRRFDAATGAAAARAQRELGDVPLGHRHHQAAAAAVELGLLRTTATGLFRPRAFASGAEAVRAVHALRDLLRP